MTRLLSQTSLIALTLLISAQSAAAFDWNSRQSFRGEVTRQMQRLEEGRQSGALSTTEYNASRSRHAALRRQMSVARANGTLASQRTTFASALSRESKTINRNKYN